MRTSLLVALSTVTLTGCGLVLGLNDFHDAPTTGSGGAGATTSSATTTSTTTGSAGGTSTSTTSTGTGGGGGMPPSCITEGSAFDVISGADVNGDAIDDKTLFTLSNPIDSTAYVMVVDKTTGAQLVRIVGDDKGAPLKGLMTFT